MKGFLMKLLKIKCLFIAGGNFLYTTNYDKTQPLDKQVISIFKREICNEVNPDFVDHALVKVGNKNVGYIELIDYKWEFIYI